MLISRTAHAAERCGLLARMDNEEQVFRFGPAYGWFGILGVFLSVAGPLLMYWNHEPFDTAVVVGFALMAAGGSWYYAYFSSYSVVVRKDGFVVNRLWRTPFRASWPDIIKVRGNENTQGVQFETTDHRKIGIVGSFPGLRPLLTVARTKLPEVLWTEWIQPAAR
jgi:hypothetical protein